MIKKYIISITTIVVSGLLLYIGTCKLLGYPTLLESEKKIPYNTPLITGHEGDTMPSIDLQLSDSTTYFNTVNISKKRPTILFYFSPYCPFCQLQLTEIINNINSLKNINFILLTSYSYAEVKSFYETNKLNKFPNIIVGIDYKINFARYFKTASFPYLAIYNADKRLINAFLGEVKYQQIEFICKK